MHRTPKTFSVELTYPAPIDKKQDELVNVLANVYGGSWFGSGVSLTSELPQRDIEFQFDTQVSADAFAAKCRGISGIQVLSVEQIEENAD